MSVSKAEHTRNLRYKRPALASLGFEIMLNELEEIEEACANVHWFEDNARETLLNALDGEEDAEYEFRVAFSDLEAKADELRNLLSDSIVSREFDDCCVAMIGNRYKVIGYDALEEDYFSLTSYQEELAYTESGKRLMRHTKNEMVSIMGQCLGVLISYLDLRQSYDYLKATFDILKDENTSMLQVIKDIDAAYEKANETNFYPWSAETKHFEYLVDCLPERAWLE